MASFASAPAPPSSLPPGDGLLSSLHAGYISSLSAALSSPSSYEGAVTAHLRMSGVYWSLAAFSLLRTRAELVSAMDGPAIEGWVWRCYDERRGGFGGNEGHDAHLLYTLSALQILALLGSLRELPADKKAKIAAYVAALVDADTGAVCGDDSGEVDTRFSYCAAQALSLLGALSPALAESICGYVARCRNFDGGYGSCPGAESHAAQVFCCVGALSICGDLSSVDGRALAFWLAERQTSGGGLNGRPEKQADVCYSWWILSSLSILGKTRYVDKAALARFILKCQDPAAGGIADRPDNVADVFHTFFGIAGLALMGRSAGRAIDPVYALPTDVVEELGLRAQVMRGSEAEGVAEYDVRERLVKVKNAAK